MRVEVFRCVCGFTVRAILVQGCATAFRPDPEAWQQRCAYSNQIQAPKDCPRFLETIDPYGQADKRSRRTRQRRS